MGQFPSAKGEEDHQIARPCLELENEVELEIKSVGRSSARGERDYEEDL